MTDVESAGRTSGAQPGAGDKAFTGSIPELYDRFMVPMIFEPYAQDMAARVAALAPHDVLEVAAGTGVVTRALERRLPDARIVATDLNQPMLDYAAKRSDGARVVWRQADALALPLDDASVDVVVCQFGAMFFPDKAKAYREARRVLRSGGAFLFSTWDRIEENEFPDVVMQALTALYREDPPQFMVRTPHGYWDVEAIRRHLATAGFSDVLVQPLERRSRAARARDVAIAFCQGTPMRAEIEARDVPLEAATEAAAAALERRFGSGPVEAKIKALVVEAR